MAFFIGLIYAAALHFLRGPRFFLMNSKTKINNRGIKIWGGSCPLDRGSYAPSLMISDKSATTDLFIEFKITLEIEQLLYCQHEQMSPFVYLICESI